MKKMRPTLTSEHFSLSCAGGLVPGGQNYPLARGGTLTTSSPLPHLSPLMSSEGLTSGSGVTPTG